MGADDRELVVGDSLEAGSLREDLPQLDVVFLAAALLPGLQRVAVVDGAAPASVYAPLDRLVVEELGPPVGEEDVEAVHERLPPAEHLDVVERPRHALRGMRRQHRHDLKAEAPEQEREDGLVRALGRHHAVHLDGRHLGVVVELPEVFVRPALQGMPERGLALLALPPRLVLHLFGELEVADVENPEIDVAVERSRSDGELGPVRLPDMAMPSCLCSIAIVRESTETQVWPPGLIRLLTRMLFTQRVFCCLTPNRLKEVLTLTNEMSSEMALIKRRVWDNSIAGNNRGYLRESDCPAIFVAERRR